MTVLAPLLWVLVLNSAGGAFAASSPPCTGQCTSTQLHSSSSTNLGPTHITSTDSTTSSGFPLTCDPIIPFQCTSDRSLSGSSFTSGSAQNTASLLSQTATISSIVPSTTAGSSTAAPVFATLVKTTSGTTVTQIIIPFLGKSTSGITLTPLLTGILHSTDPAASSTAGILGGKLTKVKSEVQQFKKGKIDPPTPFLQETLSFAEGFLQRLTPPSSHTGDCTTSLFSLVSCAISKVSSLADKVKNGIDDIGPSLLNDLTTLSEGLDKDNNDKHTNAPTDTPKPTTDNKPKPKTGGKPEPTDSPESDSSSPSSSCESISDVDHVTSVCFNTTVSTSTFLTCTPHTQTISGCDVSAFTTTTTSSQSESSSFGPPPTMTYFTHPAEPTGTDGLAELASYVFSTLKAMDRLPVVATTLGTRVSSNSKSSKQSKLSTSAESSTLASTKLHSTLTPTPTAVVEILLGWGTFIPLKDPLDWYVFKVPGDNANSTNDIPQGEACNYDSALTFWNNGTSMWDGKDNDDEFATKLFAGQHFSFPDTTLEMLPFDVEGSNTGCQYKAHPDGLDQPGSLACGKPPVELPCKEHDREGAFCEQPPPELCTDLKAKQCDRYYLIPKVWCPVPLPK